MSLRKCFVLFVVLLTPNSSTADLLVKTTQERIFRGKSRGTTHTVLKIKGPWHFSQFIIDPEKTPETGQSKDIEKRPATLMNSETGKMFVMKDGKWEMQARPSALLLETSENSMEASGSHPTADVDFKPTGRKEKVLNYDTEVWESQTDSTKITVWVALELKKYNEYEDAKTMNSNGMTKETAEKKRKAWSVLPGYVVKNRLEIDMAKRFAASVPLGAKSPKGMENMKSVTTTSVDEIRELTFTESEFPLPPSAK